MSTYSFPSSGPDSPDAVTFLFEAPDWGGILAMAGALAGGRWPPGLAGRELAAHVLRTLLEEARSGKVWNESNARETQRAASLCGEFSDQRDVALALPDAADRLLPIGYLIASIALPGRAFSMGSRDVGLRIGEHILHYEGWRLRAEDGAAEFNAAISNVSLTGSSTGRIARALAEVIARYWTLET
ncbi:MAG: hypothetical protein HYS13_19765 [Planctomycetia bacterium]|nr:hypothetical protein [Planctomycetia bacterium]